MTNILQNIVTAQADLTRHHCHSKIKFKGTY